MWKICAWPESFTHASRKYSQYSIILPETPPLNSMQAFSHSLAHRGSSASRTHAQWQPDASIQPSSMRTPPGCILAYPSIVFFNCINPCASPPLLNMRIQISPSLSHLCARATTTLAADHTAISTTLVHSRLHGASPPLPRSISRHILCRAGPRQRHAVQGFFYARGIASFTNIMRRASNSPVLH
jgi:hypothetical protein